MNVGIVIPRDYPHDMEVRPRKIAKSLSALGHKIIFISANKNGANEHKKVENGIVFPFKLFNSKLLNIFSRPNPLNIFWVFWISRIIRKENIKLLISSNVRLALPAIIAAKLMHIPIILDLQENNAAGLELLYKRRTWKNIFKNKFSAKFYENMCAFLADWVWVVVEERKDLLLRAGVRNTKIKVLSNVPELEGIRKIENLKRHLSDSGIFTLLFIGKLDSFRGLDSIIQAFPWVISKDSNIRFIIVGDGEHKIFLEKLIETLGLREFITLMGWARPDRFSEFCQRADVGVIPHHVCEHTETTIPNKLFDYMAYGLPVLASNVKPIKRIIESEKCGLIIDDLCDYPKIADKIIYLKNDLQLRERMSKNGKRAILERYNWNFEFSEMLKEGELYKLIYTK